MEKMLGMCGLDCAICPAYIATQKNDDTLRAETAEKWSKMFHADIKTENVNCDGCMSNGRHFMYCEMCNIRMCGSSKDYQTCADCDDYGCKMLMDFHAMAPEAKTTLDALR